MRAVIQAVSSASVRVNGGDRLSAIRHGND